MAIVTTTYRYKPPPKRKGRKLAEITGPAVVGAEKGRRHDQGDDQRAAAKVEVLLPRESTKAATQPTTANDPARDQFVTGKPAIVTARKPRTWRNDVPDMTPEEHQRRGDAADALFREMKRRIATFMRPGGALPPK